MEKRQRSSFRRNVSVFGCCQSKIKGARLKSTEEEERRPFKFYWQERAHPVKVIVSVSLSVFIYGQHLNWLGGKEKVFLAG